MDQAQFKIAAERVKEFADKKTVLAYVAGMATTPALVYALRYPLGKLIFPIIADEKMDEHLFHLMSYRLDWRDLKSLEERRKREGTS